MAKYCPIAKAYTNCTDNCASCMVEDEKYSNGLWDKAAEIATNIGLEFKRLYPSKFPNDEPVYAEDFGQEIIYNLLKERK